MKRRGKRRGSHRRRGSHHRRSYSSNPSGVIKQLPGRIIETGVKATESVAGIIAARKIRGLAKQQPGTIVGSAIEIGVGVAALIAGAFAGPKIARHAENVAVGCFAAPIMSGIGQLQIPHVSDALGDDGFVVGPGTGLTLVSAFPDDYRGVGDDQLGQFVTGNASTGAGAGLGDGWSNAA